MRSKDYCFRRFLMEDKILYLPRYVQESEELVKEYIWDRCECPALDRMNYVVLKDIGR